MTWAPVMGGILLLVAPGCLLNRDLTTVTVRTIPLRAPTPDIKGTESHIPIAELEAAALFAAAGTSAEAAL